MRRTRWPPCCSWSDVKRRASSDERFSVVCPTTSWKTPICPCLYAGQASDNSLSMQEYLVYTTGRNRSVKTTLTHQSVRMGSGTANRFVSETKQIVVLQESRANRNDVGQLRMRMKVGLQPTSCPAVNIILCSSSSSSSRSHLIVVLHSCLHRSAGCFPDI